jgi:hypothetical protein
MIRLSNLLASHTTRYPAPSIQSLPPAQPAPWGFLRSSGILKIFLAELEAELSKIQQMAVFMKDALDYLQSRFSNRLIHNPTLSHGDNRSTRHTSEGSLARVSPNYDLNPNVTLDSNMTFESNVLSHSEGQRASSNVSFGEFEHTIPDLNPSN